MPLIGPDGHLYVSMLLYADSGQGKSSFAATAPKPMLVFCFDQKNKERPYAKRGKVIEEGIDEEFGIDFLKIGTRKTGRHIITVEFYRDADPEKPRAIKKFLRRMSKLHEIYDKFETFVLDSVTYLEKAARWYDQFQVNVGATNKMQHYAASAEQVERQVMGRFAALPKNSIVVCHVDDEKETIGGGAAVRIPAAPGTKARQMPSAYAEVYRPFVKNGRFLLQTRTDGLWLASSQIEAPNPCEPEWSEIWKTYEEGDDYAAALGTLKKEEKRTTK